MAKEFISHYGIIAKNNSTISGSLIVTNGITGSFTGSLVGSLTGTASYASQTLSSSFSSTSSYVNTLNQDLTFNGNLTLNGTASITYLNVAYESSSIIYSSGSNQFGDATNDVQLLIGTTKVSGSFEVTGSANVTTSLTTPLIIGGSSTTQTLTYKTTTGIGTTDAHIFQVGNNGATEAMRILNNGNVGIGTTSPDVFSIGGSHKLLTVTSASGAASGILSLQGGPTGTGVIYLGNSTPIAHAAVGSLNGSNLAFYTNNSNTGTTLTERLRITSAGNVGIGTTPTTSYSLHIGKNLTGSASPVGVFNAGQIQSDATTDVAYFQVRASTAAGAYVIPDLYHYYFSTSALGAGSSITNQYGYFASAVSQATNNYGFYGNLSANATRWNVYMNGTAQNYFAGNVGIGVATPTALLHLKAGTATASTAPIKLTSGTLLTVAEAGAIEFLTDAYYATITTGAARKTFVFLDNPFIVNKTINVTFNGQEVVIPINTNVIIPATGNGGTITNWYIEGNLSGSIVIDILKNGVSMSGTGNKPTLSSAITANAAVSGWTSVVFATNDKLEIKVTTASTTLTTAYLVFKYTLT